MPNILSYQEPVHTCSQCGRYGIYLKAVAFFMPLKTAFWMMSNILLRWLPSWGLPHRASFNGVRNAASTGMMKVSIYLYHLSISWKRFKTEIILGQWIAATPIPEQSLDTREWRLEGEDHRLLLDFLSKIFRWLPEERASAQELTSHPFLMQPRSTKTSWNRILSKLLWSRHVSKAVITSPLYTWAWRMSIQAKMMLQHTIPHSNLTRLTMLLHQNIATSNIQKPTYAFMAFK